MRKTALLLLLFSAIALAEECSKGEVLKLLDSGYTKEEVNNICTKKDTKRFETDQKITHKKDDNLETWYIKFGIAYVDIKYSSELQDAVDTLEDTPGVTRSSVAVDLGVYFLINKYSIVGFNMNSVGDTFEYNGDELYINSYNYALSYMYFPEQVRDGIYFRGDIGISKGVIDGDGVQKSTTKDGIGYGVGIGYSFELGGTGLMLEAFHGSYELEDQKIDTTQIFLTGLF